jgi:hypothetical protein
LLTKYANESQRFNWLLTKRIPAFIYSLINTKCHFYSSLRTITEQSGGISSVYSMWTEDFIIISSVAVVT